MPNTKAAKKALKQNIKSKVHNLRKKREFLDIIKDYKKTVEAGGDAADKLPLIYKKLDKAAKIGIIKKNRANRLKSRLTRRLGAPSVASTTPETTPEDQA